MIQHSAECLALNAKWKHEHAAFVQQWPNYCQSCDGYGIIGVDEDESLECCSNCIGREAYWRDGDNPLIYATSLEEPKPHPILMPDPRCPRCFGPICNIDDFGPCVFCGWYKDLGLPPTDNDCQGECMPQTCEPDEYPF